MRLGILADTHDELERTRRAVQRLSDAGATALIHCGDLAGPPIVEAIAALPCWFVLGNHDADSVPALERAAAVFGPICLGWGGVKDANMKFPQWISALVITALACPSMVGASFEHINGMDYGAVWDSETDDTPTMIGESRLVVPRSQPQIQR